MRRERELQHKDRALSEAVTLLVLLGKVRAICEKPEDAHSGMTGALN